MALLTAADFITFTRDFSHLRFSCDLQ